MSDIYQDGPPRMPHWLDPTLGSEQLKAAIYFDYEGRPFHDPVLLGTLEADEHFGFIVDARYRSFANRVGAGPSKAVDHRTIAVRLIKRAYSEGRRLISWSKHDLRVMQAAVGPDRTLQRRLERSYFDASRMAKRWGTITKRVIDRPHALSRYARATHYPTPAAFGPGTVGVNLSVLDRRLELFRSYPALPSADKARWRVVFKHNKHDLRAMQHVLRFISGP